MNRLCGVHVSRSSGNTTVMYSATGRFSASDTEPLISDRTRVTTICASLISLPSLKSSGVSITSRPFTRTDFKYQPGTGLSLTVPVPVRPPMSKVQFSFTTGRLVRTELNVPQTPVRIHLGSMAPGRTSALAGVQNTKRPVPPPPLPVVTVSCTSSPVTLSGTDAYSPAPVGSLRGGDTSIV